MLTYEPAYYHLSKNPNLKRLKPRIPRNPLTRKGLEDSTTPRICVCADIQGCLRALQVSGGREFYVYSVINPFKRSPEIIPTTKDVPDCSVTHEMWFTHPVFVKKLKKIRVGREMEDCEYEYSECDYYTLNGVRLKIPCWFFEVLEEY